MRSASRIAAALTAMSRRRARLSAAEICALVSLPARAGSGGSSIPEQGRRNSDHYHCAPTEYSPSIPFVGGIDRRTVAVLLSS